MTMRDDHGGSYQWSTRVDREAWLLMSLLLTLCALLAVGLLVLPIFGAPIAVTTVLLVTFVILAECYFICLQPSRSTDAVR